MSVNWFQLMAGTSAALFGGLLRKHMKISLYDTSINIHVFSWHILGGIRKCEGETQRLCIYLQENRLQISDETAGRTVSVGSPFRLSGILRGTAPGKTTFSRRCFLRAPLIRTSARGGGVWQGAVQRVHAISLMYSLNVLTRSTYTE